MANRKPPPPNQARTAASRAVGARTRSLSQGTRPNHASHHHAGAGNASARSAPAATVAARGLHRPTRSTLSPAGGGAPAARRRRVGIATTSGCSSTSRRGSPSSLTVAAAHENGRRRVPPDGAGSKDPLFAEDQPWPAEASCAALPVRGSGPKRYRGHRTKLVKAIPPVAKLGLDLGEVAVRCYFRVRGQLRGRRAADAA